MKVRKRKSFKRVLKDILRAIVSYLISLRDNFMKLSKTTRRIIYVWLIVAVVVLLLALFANLNAKKIESHQLMEQKLEVATKQYVTKMEFYPNVNKKLKVDMDMLVAEKYLTDEDITDKTCKGYSVVYYDEVEEKYHIESYINCKHYTTKDFSLNYEQ